MVIKQSNGAVVIDIRVVPRASRSEIVGIHGDALKVRVNAPPIEGAANDELVKVLARSFGVAKQDVTIITGKAARTKRCCIRGVTTAQIDAVLNAKS